MLPWSCLEMGSSSLTRSDRASGALLQFGRRHRIRINKFGRRPSLNRFCPFCVASRRASGVRSLSLAPFCSHNVPRYHCALRIAAKVFSAGRHNHAHHSLRPPTIIFMHEYTQESSLYNEFQPRLCLPTEAKCMPPGCSCSL